MAKGKRKRALGHTAILKTAYDRQQNRNKKNPSPQRRAKTQANVVAAQQSTPATATSPTQILPSYPSRFAASVSILVGVSIAMLSVGLYTQYASIFRGTDDAARTVLGVALIALAAGIRLPQRFTMWLCAKAWHQFVKRGVPSAHAEIFINPTNADRPLYWTVLAAVTLISGLVAIMLPWVLGQSLVLHRFLLAHFVWSDPMIVVLLAGITSISVIIPFSILGIGVSFVHRLSCPFGRWDTRATAWLLLGSGIGTAVALSLRSAIPQHHIILVAGALPTLLAAVISVMASTKEPATPTSDPVPTSRLPLTSDRRPRLLRAAIVGVAGVGVCTMSIISTGSYIFSTGWMIALLLIVMGLGVLAGCALRPIDKRTIGGFGTVCIGAGVVVGICAIMWLLGWLSQNIYTLAWLCVCLTAIGFAEAYGRQTLLHRVAVRTSTGATILARITVFSAVIICVVAPLMVQILSQSTVISVLAICLLSIGTAMVFYEQSFNGRARHTRLAAACIMTVLVVASIRFAPRQLISQGAVATALFDRE